MASFSEGTLANLFLGNQALIQFSADFHDGVASQEVTRMDGSLGTGQSWADTAAKLGQAFALVAGGLWVLLNYFLDRIHVRRLQLELIPTLELQGDLLHVVVAISVTNPGKTNVLITKKGSALIIGSLRNYDSFMLNDDPEWDYEHAFDIFAQGRIGRETLSIEPGITVREDQLLLLPIRREPYLMVLRVRSSRSFLFGRNLSWTYAKVLTASLAGANKLGMEGGY